MSIFLTILIEISVYSKHTYAALGYAPVHDIAYIYLCTKTLKKSGKNCYAELFYSG